MVVNSYINMICIQTWMVVTTLGPFNVGP